MKDRIPEHTETTALVSAQGSSNTQNMTDEQMKKLLCACLMCASLTLAFSAVGYFGGNFVTLECIPGAIKPGTCGPISPDITAAQLWSPCGSTNPFRAACFSLIWGGASIFGAGLGSLAAKTHVQSDDKPTNVRPINI